MIKSSAPLFYYIILKSVNLNNRCSVVKLIFFPHHSLFLVSGGVNLSILNSFWDMDWPYSYCCYCHNHNLVYKVVD